MRSVLASLRHPDLVLFLGASCDSSSGNSLFFLSEYMEGGDLESYFKQKSKKLGRRYHASTWKQVRWSTSVARALCFLHNRQRPIIHRDLKPLNILLTAHKDAKLADFGISKIVSPEVEAGTPGATMSGGVGTWFYMAPEVARHEQYTDRADIYSFALVMYFMAIGAHPFASEFGKDAVKLLEAYCAKKEPRPQFDPSAIMRPIRQLMEASWHVDQGERPSAEQCVQSLCEIKVANSNWWLRCKALFAN